MVVNKLKKLLSAIFVLTFFFILGGVKASPASYYSPSYCPYALAITGVVGTDTHLIRVAGSTGKIAYCLDPLGDVPYLGYPVIDDGEEVEMNSSHRLNYTGELELPGVSYIIYYGDSPKYISDTSGGNTIISSNMQWMPYAWSYENSSYSIPTGNNVPYEDVKNYMITQYAIWWYENFIEPGTWGNTGGGANFKDLALNGNTSVITDLHVRYPNNQTTAEATAIARRSADLACSAYAATKGIYTVSSLPSDCQKVYNNGQAISPTLHDVIANHRSWGNSSITMTNDITFTYSNNSFISNEINFETNNIVGNNGVRILNYTDLPADVKIILKTGTVLTRDDLSDTAVTTGFKVMLPKSSEGANITITLYGDGSNDKISFYRPNVEPANGNDFQRLFVTDDIYVSASKSAKVPDAPKTGSLTVNKVDSEDSNIKLNNATFQLYSDNACTVKAKNASGTELGPYTTENGSFTISNLLYGTYYLKELAPPEGYILADECVPVNVNGNIDFLRTNEKIEILVVKRGSDNSNALEGAKILVYDADNEVVTTLVTDENGQATLSLKAGEYTLIEQEAPLGYVISKDVIKIRVDERGNIEVLSGDAIFQNDSLNIYNTPTSIIISKQNITNSEELPGAKIEIKDENGDVVISFTSEDKPRQFYINPGIYTLTETMAPEGFQRLETVLTFQVGPHGEIEILDTNVSLENFEIKDGVLIIKNQVVEVPDTASFIWVGGIIIGAGLILVGVYVLRRYKNGKEKDER